MCRPRQARRHPCPRAPALELEQLTRREPRRPARDLTRLDRLDAREADELFRRFQHLPDWGALPQRARNRADELGQRERRLRRGQPVRREQPRRELLPLDAGGCERTLVGEPAKLAPAEAVLGRPHKPLLAQRRQVDLLLGLPGRERRNPGGSETLRPERLHVLEQRPPPGRERPDRALRDLRQLAHPFHRLRPLEPEPPGKLVPQLRLVQVAGREPVGAQDRLTVERAPPAISGAGHVRDDHVRVEMRILRPARAVPERRRHEPLTVLADGAAVTAAHDARLPLEIGDRRLPGRLVRLAHLTPHPLVVGQRMQQAQALRAREHEVVARDRREPLLLLLPLAAPDIEHPHRDRPRPHRRPQRGPARRIDTTQQRPEIAVLDHADEPERRGTASRPHTRRLAAARVVVV